MNQRERFLAILVGGMLVGLVVWWGFGKFRDATKRRTNQIATLEGKQKQLREQIMQGHLADRQMTEYRLRSLPGNPERAQSDYQQWLLSVGREYGVDGLAVDPTTSMPVGDLYQRLGFRVSGKASMSDLIGVLHSFYAKDYLHRIRELSIRKVKGETDLSVEMSIDAMALLDVAADAEPPGDSSWRIDGDLASYRDPILNRNFFSPPNAAPSFTGNKSINATVGRETPVPLAFKDPEGNRVTYELVGEPSDAVRLDRRSGTLRIRSDKEEEFSIRIRATDDGYPAKSVEQELLVKVANAPPPPPEEKPELEFDDATQTVLTGLVHGRDEWTAWMHVRTRDQTLKLRVGDKFEIGSLNGEVVEVTPRFAVLEIAGRRFTLKPNGNLKDAADKSEVD